MKTTQRDAEGAFNVLATALDVLGVPVDGWELTRWAPGDGVARYRVESDGGARTPLGARYWLGATEAYSALSAATAAVVLLFDRVEANLA